MRVYINSLALQAVAGRMWKDDGRVSRSQVKDSQDCDFVREVIDASSTVLEMVIELSRDGKLKYLPVRIFIRVASASMYLINVCYTLSTMVDGVRSLKLIIQFSRL